MATRKSQRIFIWVITVVMIIGTIFSFAVMVIAPQNSQADQERYDKLLAEYSKETETWQKKVDVQTKKLSDKYYATFVKYKSTPATFASNDVKKLTTKELKMGTGATINKDTKLSMYYIGWNPKGETFDSSFDDKKLKMPLMRESEGVWTFADGTQGPVITGWEEGIIGMKIGGVRQLTIPSDKAYGEQGQGESIPANTPLKFIIMAVPHTSLPAQPEVSPELLQLDQTMRGY